MRITLLGQYLKGVQHYDVEQAKQMTDRLDNKIKWHPWYGNVSRAKEHIGSREMDAEGLEIEYPKLIKIAKAIREFRVYIENSQDFIQNYGERYRCGERFQLDLWSLMLIK